MKKLSLTLVVIAASLTSMFAQITAPTGYTFVAPTGSNSSDTVTIGSIMPYQVTGDPNMHALRLLGILDYSHYTKSVNGGGTILAADGSSAAADADSAFSVSWASTGSYTISVTEVPQVKTGFPSFSCTANASTLPVVVVNRPTAAFGTAPTSGCSIDGTTVSIPYTVTGTGKFAVSYKITYTPLSGSASDVVTTTSTVSDYATVSGASFNFTYAVPSGAYGRYDVYFTDLKDRISVKSGVNTVAGNDYPTTALSFYAYPTPVSQPIQHIKNL